MSILALLAAGTATAGAEHEATLLGFNAEDWVYVSLTIFLIGLIWFGRAHHRIRDALDAKIAEVRRDLDEAARLRAEAEALLADAKRRHQAGDDSAAAIIAQAEEEAREMLEEAEADSAELMKRRAAMAEDKIAAAERQAIAEVRASAAAAAARAAEDIITARHDAAADRALVDRTIAGLARPN
ncbi:MAG: F0F1 ATP synthase subunit B family protein [Sphingomonas sp.]